MRLVLCVFWDYFLKLHSSVSGLKLRTLLNAFALSTVDIRFYLDANWHLSEEMILHVLPKLLRIGTLPANIGKLGYGSLCWQHVHRSESSESSCDVHRFEKT